MHAKAVLVDTIDIVVLTHVDAVTIMIGIAAPNKVVVPKVLPITEIIGEESEGTKDGRGKRIAVCHQLLRHHSTAIFHHLFPHQVPAGF